MDGNTTVAEIIQKDPRSAAVLGSFHIEYRIGGDRRLEEACALAGASISAVLAALAREAAPPRPVGTDDLSALVRYVVDKHHVYTRSALVRVQALLETLTRARGLHRPELSDLQKLVAALAADLVPHMDKEERVLFPYLVELASAAASNRLPRVPRFGSLRTPLAKMHDEHETVGVLLHDIERVTADTATGRLYVTPADGSAAYRELMASLAELVHDVREHLSLETWVVFPLAERLEEGLRAGAPAKRE